MPRWHHSAWVSLGSEGVAQRGNFLHLMTDPRKRAIFHHLFSRSSSYQNLDERVHTSNTCRGGRRQVSQNFSAGFNKTSGRCGQVMKAAHACNYTLAVACKHTTHPSRRSHVSGKNSGRCRQVSQDVSAGVISKNERVAFVSSCTRLPSVRSLSALLAVGLLLLFLPSLTNFEGAAAFLNPWHQCTASQCHDHFPPAIHHQPPSFHAQWRLKGGGGGDVAPMPTLDLTASLRRDLMGLVTRETKLFLRFWTTLPPTPQAPLLPRGFGSFRRRRYRNVP